MDLKDFIQFSKHIGELLDYTLKGKPERIPDYESFCRAMDEYTTLDSLLATGCITEQEAQNFRAPNRPDFGDKKIFAIYLLLYCFPFSDFAPESPRFKALVEEWDFTGMRGSESLLEFLGVRRSVELMKAIRDDYVSEYFNRIKDFVFEKRRRLRESVKVLVLAYMLKDLYDYEEGNFGEVDYMPGFLDFLDKHKFSFSRKLTASDRAILERYADIALTSFEGLLSDDDAVRRLIKTEDPTAEAYRTPLDEFLFVYAEAFFVYYKSYLIGLGLNTSETGAVEFAGVLSYVLASKKDIPEDSKYYNYFRELIDGADITKKYSPEVIEICKEEYKTIGEC